MAQLLLSLFKPRNAEACTIGGAFPYYQCGLHVEQLEFLLSIRYIKASRVFSSWERNWGSWVFLKYIFISGSCQRRFHNLGNL